MQVPFSRVCYIEATDFKESDEKDFYGLAPGKSVMLRWVWGGWLVHPVLGVGCLDCVHGLGLVRATSLTSPVCPLAP